MSEEEAHQQGILLARPGSPAAQEPQCGTLALNLDSQRDGLLHVPPGLDASRPIPLVIMLHGAGGDARGTLPFMIDEANARGFLVLVPESRGGSWDVIRGGYGPDVAFLDRALELTFGSFTVDPARIAIGGFSDGASYALCLGITNGELFSDILAFSPGFAAPGRAAGVPRIFISHGNADTVLPVDRCGRRLAQILPGSGYDVDYHEFEGGHVVPAEMVDAAVRRFLS